MEKDINIRDYFKIDDSHSKIRGFVFAYDENGNLVFTKENMIVKEGRKLIFNAITGGTAFNAKGLTAKVGSGTNMTEETSTGLNNKIADEKIEIIDGKDSPETKTDSELYIKFSFSVKPKSTISEQIEISELGLFNGETMFSRLVFQPYKLTNGSTLTFNYYIYF